jgi:tetratricopeptide (TPR) repeat protein
MARTAANELIDFCKYHGYLSNHVRTLIYVAVMRLNSDRMQCTAAMPVLLEALAMCEKLEMHALHATGMSVLAIIFLRLQNPQRAISILEAVLPTLIQREHVWFQAEAFLTLAKSHLKVVQSSIKGDEQQLSSSEKRRYERALHALRQSMELFEACQDCVRLREVLFLQANIYSMLGKIDKREQCSEQFIKIGSGSGTGHEQQQKKKTTSTILDALNDPIQLETLIDRSVY